MTGVVNAEETALLASELVPAEVELELSTDVVVTGVVTTLTISASSTGLTRVEFRAGTAALPATEVTSTFLSCSVSRLVPAVATVSRVPVTAAWLVRIWKLWSVAGLKPFRLLSSNCPPNCRFPLAVMRS